MKIAQVHPYPPEIDEHIPILPGGATQGGSETSTFQYALKLSESGHDVTYYVAKYPGVNVDRLRLNDKFEIVYLNTIFKNMGPAFSVSLLIRLIKGKYDVIQSHQIPTTFTFIAGLASLVTRRPFIITFHGRLPYSWIDGGVGYLASMMSNAVTVQNKYAYHLLSPYVQKSKLVIIPHGINMDLFKKKQVSKAFLKELEIKKDQKVVLFVGRLIQPKGVDVLLNAFKIICEAKIINAKLVIIGAGDEMDSLKKLAESNGVNDKVIFVGPVKQNQLPLYYSISDAFVLPSTYHRADGTIIPKVSENFGLVLAEAMSCKVPVIASRVGGIPHWITDKKSGYLFEERNEVELSDTLISVLNMDKESSKIVTEYAYNYIKKNYSWEAVIERFTPLFTK